MDDKKRVGLFIIFGILLVLSFSIITGQATEVTTVICSPNQKVGDVNGDGLINSEDANLVLKIAVGEMSAPSNICCADANKDGEISSYDSSLILQGNVSGTCPTNQAVNYSGTCSALVDQIANPSDFEKDGVNYYLQWSGSSNGSWWKNEYINFTEYDASWSLNYQDGDNYRYGYLSKSVILFGDENFDASEILEESIRNNFCQVHSYSDNFGNDNKVYVCNWNVYERGVNIDSYNWKNREILWNNENVLVRLSVGFGGRLSDEEINKIMEKETIKFINSLKDNQGRYIGWENFDLDSPFNNQMFDSLEICPSEVSQDACSPSWQCITEPAVCPEYGYQTQTCKDYGCENEDIVSQISCNPGICSGCLVPKWFDSDSLGNNKCIPYGFRFENQIGWTFEEQISTGSEILTVQNAIGSGGEVNLSISSDGVATLEVEGWGRPYTFRQGDRVEVDVTGWDKNFVSLSFIATEVVYDAENYENSYVLFDFTYVYLGQVEETINAYCDIDGYVKPQKTKTEGGLAIKCQNNYECESNQCSNGVCIDLSEQIKSEAGFFKSLGCRILNIISFGSVDYDQCLAGNTAANQGGGGGGGGG